MIQDVVFCVKFRGTDTDPLGVGETAAEGKKKGRNREIKASLFLKL